MPRAVALLAIAATATVACGSQFAPRTDHDVPAVASQASAASAPPAASTAPATSATLPRRGPGEAKKIVARHVLVQWMGCKRADTNIVRTKEQARSVAQEVLRRLKAGEDFAKIVIDFSDEPNAGQRGGSLPPFGRGAMDKAFEDAAFSLMPGELSGIVESEFGFHVIQRLE